MKMSRSQLNAIGYALTKRGQKQAEAEIIKIDGTLDKFKNSRYKSAIWYLRSIKK